MNKREIANIIDSNRLKGVNRFIVLRSNEYYYLDYSNNKIYYAKILPYEEFKDIFYYYIQNKSIITFDINKIIDFAGNDIFIINAITQN